MMRDVMSNNKYPQEFKGEAVYQMYLFDYIEMFYNRKRLHSHLGHVSPDEYEKQFLIGRKIGGRSYVTN